MYQCSMGLEIFHALGCFYYDFPLHFGCTQPKYHSLLNIHHRQLVTKFLGILKHNKIVGFVWANMVSPSKFLHPTYHVGLIHSCLPVGGPLVSTSLLFPL